MVEKELKKNLHCLIGLMFFCAMLRPPFVSSLISAGIPDAHNLRVIYDALLIVLGISYAIASFVKKEASILPVSALAHLGCLSALGGIILNAGKFLFGYNQLLLVAGVSLTSLGLGFILIGWVSLLSTFARQLILPLFAAAFVASHVFGVFDLLPRDIEAMVVVLYPLCSSMFLLMGLKRNEVVAECDHDQQPPEQKPQTSQYFARLQGLSVMLIGVEIICGALLRSSYAHLGVGYSPNSTTFSTYLGSAAIGVIAYLIVRRSKYASENTLLIGGLCLLPMLFAAVGLVFFSGRSLAPLITGVFSMLVLLLIGMISLWHRDNDIPTGASGGIALACYGVSIDITFTIIPFLLGIEKTATSDQTMTVALLGGLAIAIGVSACLFAMIVLQRRDFTQALEKTGAESNRNDQPVDVEETHNRAVEEISNQYGLTTREREIALLIARGYTVKHIAEDLVLSTGTVQSHSKNVYRKLGIHRKDELIELVEVKRSKLGQ